ncbi:MULTISPECIES: hypothetical protein [Aerosakkonema]|uniref:hypothetical protein n=1 Tax=Aerosakkonema TaxID=1246629 RepID=UPI0035B88A9E
MTGHHKFNQLIKNISPERKARIAEKTAQLKQEIALGKKPRKRESLVMRTQKPGFLKKPGF